MTNKEILNEFNLLYDNINSDVAPGLDSFEISQFLTKVQNDTVQGFYSGENPYGEAFEQNTELSKDLDVLVKSYTVSTELQTGSKICNKSHLFQLPDDVWFIVFEQAQIKSTGTHLDNKNLLVVPVSHDQVFKQLDNPFKGPSDDRILRIDSMNGGIAELISNYPVNSYFIRYVRHPKPILLDDYSSRGLSIEGIQAGDPTNPCELELSMQHFIIEKAAELAKTVYQA